MFIIISQQTLEAHQKLEKKCFQDMSLKLVTTSLPLPENNKKNPGATGKKNHSFFQLFGPIKK